MILIQQNYIKMEKYYYEAKEHTDELFTIKMQTDYLIDRLQDKKALNKKEKELLIEALLIIENLKK